MKEKTTSGTSSTSPFTGKTFVLEPGRDIGFKAKQELINYLRAQGASISYILTASTDYVLTTDSVNSHKIHRAKQLGLPLVNIEYINEYRRLPAGQTYLDINKFLIKSVEDQENFAKSGTITIAGTRANAVKVNKFDATKIKLWNSDDIQLPRFNELSHCEIGRWAIFKETNDNSDVFFAIELQVIPEQYYDQTESDYRLRFRYDKRTVFGEQQNLSTNASVQYAFSNDSSELQYLFASYYNRIATMPRVTKICDMLPDKLGSRLLLRSLFTHRIDTQILDENICQLVESIWLESIGDLNKMLSVSLESITLKMIIEAEAALLELKSTNDPAAANRFYSLLPHRPEYQVDLLKNRRLLTEKIDLCQMLRDLLTVNELTNWNVKAPIEAKYRALKCHIETLNNSSLEYKNVERLIQASTDSGEKIVIHNIFNVAKQTDALNFCTTISNQRQLFHGSKYANFLGILSRGLAMPKMVVDELGVERTDIGCLGFGLYFSDSASTSLKYTTASKTRQGRRLLSICQVALGESANYYSFVPKLTKPPNGFQSTHGVKRTEDNNSMFIDNEYAIYQLDQQRLLYLVEVSWVPHDDLNIKLERLPITHHEQNALKKSEQVQAPTAIDDEVIEVAEQDYGLICPSSGKMIPLKSFHVRAQIVDATVEVVFYQVYHNTSSQPIEAKYVFPLDENSTVCGFEAHINNKVIKGVVKEKEQAKREYREAIEKGHGAYLMHQEQAQVFSVAVGNLPANNEVIIKITYVAELEIENNDILFRLPAKMASWQSKQAVDSKDQSTVRSIGILDERVEFSFKTSIRMPYEITKLFSPTHRLRRKITDCIAMVELVDNVLLDRDFVLLIALKSANLPRILNETFAADDNNKTLLPNDRPSQACMLSFYPRFETLTNSNDPVEIIFMIDVSNSMDGNSVQQAKQLAHLFLTNLKIDDGNTHFNIITFGSDNNECFPISERVTKENLEKAKHFVLHSLIHRGNTDLFAVLHRYSLLPSPISANVGRQFILLSDGHIHDLESIVALLEHRSTMSRDRLFTCSIGDVSNKHGLKQLARAANAGGLVTIFDSNYRSRWKTKVLNILEHIRQPCVRSISIDWHGNVNEGEKFHMQAPKIIRSLFNGMRLSVYRFIDNCHKATLTAIIDGQEFVTTVFSSTMTTTTGRILHCLTTRAIIDDYENGLLHMDESENELIKVQCKRDLIDLSIKYSVVSPYTSFIAVEERDTKQSAQTHQPGVRLLDVMLDRDVDLLPYISWDGEQSNLAMIKKNLIDAKISLESASIQGKKEMVVDIEKQCQKISYRTGGDAKFDMMMSLIRAYRYSLNEHDKADALENMMRRDIKNEMLSATTEERQTLMQRCQASDFVIHDDEIHEKSEELEYANLKKALKRSTIPERMEMLTNICSSLGEKPTLEDVMLLSLSSSSSERSSPCAEMMMPNNECLSPSNRLEAFSPEEDEEEDLDFGFLDTLDECSYKEITTNLQKMLDRRPDQKLRASDIELAKRTSFGSNARDSAEYNEEMYNSFASPIKSDEKQTVFDESNLIDLITEAEVEKQQISTTTSTSKVHGSNFTNMAPMSPPRPSPRAKPVPRKSLPKAARRLVDISVPISDTLCDVTRVGSETDIALDVFEDKVMPEKKEKSFNTGPAHHDYDLDADFMCRISFRNELDNLNMCQESLNFAAPSYAPPPLPPPPPLPSLMIKSSMLGACQAFSDSKPQAYMAQAKAAMAPPQLPKAPPATATISLASKTMTKKPSSCMSSSVSSEQNVASRGASSGFSLSGKHGNMRSPTVVKTIETQSLEIDGDALESNIMLAKAKRKRKALRVSSLNEASPTQDDIMECSIAYDVPLQELLLLDVSPLSLGIEDIHGNMRVLIPRNTTIPTRKQSSVFTNAFAYQATATIRIFEGEHKSTKYNNFLGEFSLCDLSSNFTAQTLEIAIRMEIDANGILTVFAEEVRSGAQASLIIVNDGRARLSKNDIERHIAYVQSDSSFAAEPVDDRNERGQLYSLHGKTITVAQNFSDVDQITGTPSFSVLKNLPFTELLMGKLIKIQSNDGSFLLNKQLADTLQMNPDKPDAFKDYLREHGFNSLAPNIRDEIIRLIATGIILIWLIVKTQAIEPNTDPLLFDIELIRAKLSKKISSDMYPQVDKAIDFYQHVVQRNGIYCRHLELGESSWNGFIQRLVLGNNC